MHKCFQSPPTAVLTVAASFTLAFWKDLPALTWPHWSSAFKPTSIALLLFSKLSRPPRSPDSSPPSLWEKRCCPYTARRPRTYPAPVRAWITLMGAFLPVPLLLPDGPGRHKLWTEDGSLLQGTRNSCCSSQLLRMYLILCNIAESWRSRQVEHFSHTFLANPVFLTFLVLFP